MQTLQVEVVVYVTILRKWMTERVGKVERSKTGRKLWRAMVKFSERIRYIEEKRDTSLNHNDMNIIFEYLTSFIVADLSNIKSSIIPGDSIL